MKKHVTLLFLGLLLVSLTGCNKAATDPDTTPEPTTGISSETITGAPQEALPTPTPVGNYVAFNLDSGFYEKSQTISLSCNVEGALIYYTLDGSTPNKTSTLYEKEFTVSRKLYTQNVLAAQTGISAGSNYVPDYAVDKCTVIRAIAYLPDGTTTPVAHASYFIGLDREKYGDVPVVSLITDFENL
ncbi:MAG: chitobiase/beta-hexosaminidase C-terminal domain-containing protein, partial [Lachnospiraceae bacterium]|nr:chitobiase/beta-hexosaminidase C-terminal domain-containing protein [Lachnospiraceae bacterium]